MGVYDTVGKEEIQIKCTPEPGMDRYNIGNEIPLRDGLYMGYEGWFVVRKKRVLNCGEDIYTKWGDKINLEKILDSYNKIAIMCENRNKKKGE